MSSALNQLCACYGIMPDYHDMWGQHHQVPDAARRALLEAMHVPAADDGQVLASLLELEHQRWSAALPPVRVVRETHEMLDLPVALSADDEHLDHRWWLVLEGGETRHGQFRPDDLSLIERHEAPAMLRVCLRVPLGIPVGYHRFGIGRGAQGPALAEMSLIVVPVACYQPPVLAEGGRRWGFGVQLYGLRSTRNWGVGDFTDLGRLLDFAADAGADTVLLNPLHALFPEMPEHASPYSPSSRSGLNVLYLDVEAMTGAGDCRALQARLADDDLQRQLELARQCAQVDYTVVAGIKLELARLLHQHFRSTELAENGPAAQAFAAFKQAGGRSLHLLAVFEALQAHFRADDTEVWGWPAWPAAYHDPDGPAVRDFIACHDESVDFHAYLQWQAWLQLDAAGRRSLERGLGVGLMFDLAIGVAEGGAATWMRQSLHARGASAGAPPDEINRMGQDWGLPPWIPHRLKEAAYQPFIEVLRANMQASGALRMDHVMGLRRLFWVARGQPVADGAYVSYPFDDLLGILALESWRNRCMVIGEDLGTVPDEVRHALDPAGVLSTRLMYFERGADGGLKPARDYPVNALAAISTHDLPTLSAFWDLSDLSLREAMQLFPDAAVRDKLYAQRFDDRPRLLEMLHQEGFLCGSGELELDQPMNAQGIAAVHGWLAGAPSKLVMVQIEDALGVDQQPNLPGVIHPRYPCWRLKLPVPLEAWWQTGTMQALVDVMRRIRRR